MKNKKKITLLSAARVINPIRVNMQIQPSTPLTSSTPHKWKCLSEALLMSTNKKNISQDSPIRALILAAESRENVPLNMHKMQRFRSSYSCAKYYPGLCSPFMHSVVSIDSVSRQ